MADDKNFKALVEEQKKATVALNKIAGINAEETDAVKSISKDPCWNVDVSGINTSYGTAGLFVLIANVPALPLALTPPAKLWPERRDTGSQVIA